MHCFERLSDFWIEDGAQQSALTSFGARRYVCTDTLDEQNVRQAVDHYLRAWCRFRHFRREQLQGRVHGEGLGLIGLDQYQFWEQTVQGLDTHRTKAEPSRDYGGRGATSGIVNHVAAILRCGLTKAARSGARIVPQCVGARRR